MRIAAYFIAVVFAASPALANAKDVTWVYSGTITYVLRNTIGVPSPLGEPVEVSITFDPDTVVTYPNISFGGRHAMFGGNTSFRVQIGEHASDPINAFRMDAVTENCCASNDLYHFLSHDPPGRLMNINFPGFVEDAILGFRLEDRFRPGPITSNELPVVQPNPNDFREVQLGIIKRVGSSTVFAMYSTDLKMVVPEPTSSILVAVAAIYGLASCRWRSLAANDVR
jgi:hypothetical protein